MGASIGTNRANGKAASFAAGARTNCASCVTCANELRQRRTMAFPPRPDPFRGRAAELRTLVVACRAGARLALVGAGGSGKSTLAAALGHRLRAEIPGGREWFRVGRWDH